MTKTTADHYIAKLGLQQHVEGGAFKEHYRSPLLLAHSALSAGHRGDRPASTAIYFLLRHGEFSAFHLLASDEVMHFYDGEPLHIHEINAAGHLHVHRLGRDLDGGEQFSVVIPGGSWFALRCEVPGGFSLIGCTVAPAFDFDDFTLGDRTTLVERFPQHAQLIQSMTYEGA